MIDNAQYLKATRSSVRARARTLTLFRYCYYTVARTMRGGPRAAVFLISHYHAVFLFRRMRLLNSISNSKPVLRAVPIDDPRILALGKHIENPRGKCIYIRKL